MDVVITIMRKALLEIISLVILALGLECAMHAVSSIVRGTKFDRQPWIVISDAFQMLAVASVASTIIAWPSVDTVIASICVLAVALLGQAAVHWYVGLICHPRRTALGRWVDDMIGGR